MSKNLEIWSLSTKFNALSNGIYIIILSKKKVAGHFYFRLVGIFIVIKIDRNKIKSKFFLFLNQHTLEYVQLKFYENRLKLTLKKILTKKNEKHFGMPVLIIQIILHAKSFS